MYRSSMKSFPSQTVSDEEKASYDYGLDVAKAIEREWFDTDTGYHGRHHSSYNDFHNLRLYARGEQSVQKYKDELSINGDLSYLNLDWKPVPIIPKFVDLVVNGMANRVYDIKAYSQDPYGVEKRTEYMESILKDMKTKEFNEQAKTMFNMDLAKTPAEKLPQTEEELELHMQLTYKQAVEIAEEQAISVLLEGNRYELTKKRFYYDLAVLGIGATKTTFNTSEGVKVEYVDPANLVYSYTESPYFEDIYYVGEIKEIPINELAKQFPSLSQDSLDTIQKEGGSIKNRSGGNRYRTNEEDDYNKVAIVYFNYKTYHNEVYKIKDTGSGGERAIQKTDAFNPPDNMEGGFGKLQRSVECLYEGALVLGTDIQGFGGNTFTFGKTSNRVYNVFTSNASSKQVLLLVDR